MNIKQEDQFAGPDPYIIFFQVQLAPSAFCTPAQLLTYNFK